MSDFKNITLRERLKDYIPAADDRILDVESIELLYEMWKNPFSTEEEKDFAVKKLIASFLSINNTNKYCVNNNTNTSVVDNEDLDNTIALTVFRCLNAYKSDGGTDKDNFLRYCVGAIKKEVFKEHKRSLPFYVPHTTKKQREKMLKTAKNKAVILDENGTPLRDDKGQVVYVQKRKIISLRDGTKCNRTLEGELIEVSQAKYMDDKLFEREYIFDNSEYYGLKTFSVQQTFNQEDEKSISASHAVDYDITESLIGNQLGNYKELHSRCWEVKLMNEDLIQKMSELPGGNIVVYRYGLDRGYPRTVKEVCNELGYTTKYVNYWVERAQETFAKKYPNYYEEYFSA